MSSRALMRAFLFALFRGQEPSGGNRSVRDHRGERREPEACEGRKRWRSRSAEVRRGFFGWDAVGGWVDGGGEKAGRWEALC